MRARSVLLALALAAFAPSFARADDPTRAGRGLRDVLDEDVAGRPPRARSGQGELDAALAKAPEGLLGDHQRGRVRPAYAALTAGERAAFDRLLVRAGSATERALLLKGLAAGNRVKELEPFAEGLRGKEPGWLLERASLSGPKGVAQQYSHACGATVVQALRAEYDPVYARRVREENADVHAFDRADGAASNPALAEEQRDLLERARPDDGEGGLAVSRDDSLLGRGRWIDDELNELAPRTGLVYTTTKDPPAEVAVKTLRDALEGGRATPIVVGGPRERYAHYALVTAVRATPRDAVEFLVHDPWSGSSGWISAEAITRRRAFEPPLSAFDRISAIEVPGLAKDH